MNSRFLCLAWCVVLAFSTSVNAAQYQDAASASAACIAAASGNGSCIGYGSAYYHQNTQGQWVAAFTYVGGCSVTEVPDPVTGECQPAPTEPEECAENGQAWQSNGTCIDECPNGELDGICLDQSQGDCDATSSDLVAISGGVPICSPDEQCPGGSQGLFNGELVCLPPADNLPTCEAGSITIITEGGGGYVCGAPSSGDGAGDNGNGGNDGPLRDGDGNAIDNNGDPDQNPEASEGNSDSTVIDQNGNVSNGTTTLELPGLGQIEFNTRQTASNTHQANQLLQQIANNTSDNPEPCDPVSQNCPSTMDDLLDHLNERAVIPDELGLSPTFSDTTNAFRTSLDSVPIILAFSEAPSINLTSACPTFSGQVYMIGNVVFDIHCTILEDYRSQLSAIFTAVWLIAAATVFLRA